MRALLVLLAALALPASASAAPLGEIAPLKGAGDPTCVKPTGTPGELTMPTVSGVQFVQATRAGFQRGQRVELGAGFSCGSVATQPNGAGVIAGTAANRLVVAVRDPGGAWSAPIKLTDPASGDFPSDIVAAVSDRGDAIVAWQGEEPTQERQFRLRVARRAPGGSFRPTEQIGADTGARITPWAGVTATGEAFVLSSTAAGPQARSGLSVAVAGAPVDGPFGAPVALGTARWFSRPSLAVAPDGRALVAWSEGAAVRVAEREPGGAFGPPAAVGPAPALLSSPTVRLAAGGAAAVSWKSALTDAGQIATRSGPGPFSAPVVTATAVKSPGVDPFYASDAYYEALFGQTNGNSESELVFFGAEEQVELTADGRAVLSLTRQEPTGSLLPKLATIPLAGGPLTTAEEPPLFSTAYQTLPLVLADGTPAMLWTELTTSLLDFSLRPSAFRVRLAAEGVVAPVDARPVPKVTIGAPRKTRLGINDRLVLPVTCSAACDVSATLDSPNGLLSGFGDSVHLRKAGRGQLQLMGAAAVAPALLGPIRIRIVYGARDTLRPRSRTITRRIARTKALVVPRFTSLRARRVGDRVRVTVRAETAAGDNYFAIFASGEDTRGWNGEPILTRTVVFKEGRRSATFTLPAEGVNYVVVRMPFDYGPGSKLVTKVK